MTVPRGDPHGGAPELLRKEQFGRDAIVNATFGQTFLIARGQSG